PHAAYPVFIDVIIATRPLGCYRVKPHGPLVHVSSTPCSASTPCLSTSWSRWALQEALGLRDVSS
ncbi:hypothetical protein HALTITAN_3300, partial [Vreelandella titanicae BH1]